MEHYGTILLVEDDISLANWVAEYLIEQGYQTTICQRGDQVVEQVRKTNPDLVLLDIMLPGQDGISVCRDLRQFYQAPIIMLTARDDEMDEVIGLEVGASDYMMKPVRPRALLARIKAALRSKSDTQESSTSSELINCASQEYFKAVDTSSLNAKIITPVFKEDRDGELKIISFSAKRARGMMARYIIQNDLKKSEEIKSFSEDGYKFAKNLSTESEFVFVR